MDFIKFYIIIIYYILYIIMKPCITCGNKPIKNGIYKAHLEHFAEKQLPKDNKPYHAKDASLQKIKLSGLKPNQTIFYFGAGERDFTKSIKPRLVAYGKLKNSGVARIDKDGVAITYLHCPQLYVNYDGKIYSRHMHFLYWDELHKTWNKNLYTQQVLCKIDKDANTKKVCMVDARPEEMYEKKHLEGSVSMPYNKKWTEEKVLDVLNITKDDKLIPILLYSGKDKDLANQLYNKLNKLGFYNTMFM
jgi:hypothetical protein